MQVRFLCEISLCFFINLLWRQVKVGTRSLYDAKSYLAVRIMNTSCLFMEHNQCKGEIPRSVASF